jgi:membrane-bound ClpP family serine protease
LSGNQPLEASVGTAALVLGIIGIVFAIIPTFGITQLVAIVLGLVALILGIVARKSAAEQGQPTGTATAGLVLGILATVLSALIYASCMYCVKKVGDGMEKVGEEFKKQLGSEQFKKEFREALEKARKQGNEVGKQAPEKAEPKK